MHWRRTDRGDSRDVDGTTTLLPGVTVDDTLVGASALSAGGAESLVSFAGPQRR